MFSASAFSIYICYLVELAWLFEVLLDSKGRSRIQNGHLASNM